MFGSQEGKQKSLHSLSKKKTHKKQKPETKMGEVAKLTPTGNPLSPHRTNPERL